MTSLPKADSDTNVTKHTIKIGTKSLLMSLYETEDSITLYIGGHDMYCLDINIIKYTSKMASTFDPTIANLSKIQWNQNCSLEYNFRRGIDSNMILKFAITYIQKTYPHVKGISFNDASFRTCDNGQNVSLAMMSYISTGQTWYEKNFGAYLEPEYISIFKSAKQRFIESKNNISWESMKSIFRKFPMDESKMKTIFESATTWQDFFGPIKDIIGISEFCIFIAPWLDKFLNRTMRYNILGLQYILPIKDYGIVYTVSEYQRGGRGLTRKRINTLRRSIDGR